MTETIQVLLLAPHPNEGTRSGIYIDDPEVRRAAIAAAHSQKPKQLQNIVSIEGSLVPTDEDQMKQLFPQEGPTLVHAASSTPTPAPKPHDPPPFDIPPVEEEPPKTPRTPPPPIRAKNVDVAKGAETKPVGVS